MFRFSLIGFRFHSSFVEAMKNRIELCSLIKNRNDASRCEGNVNIRTLFHDDDDDDRRKPGFC